MDTNKKKKEKTEEEYEKEIEELRVKYRPMTQEEFRFKLKKTVEKWHKEDKEKDAQ